MSTHLLDIQKGVSSKAVNSRYPSIRAEVAQELKVGSASLSARSVLSEESFQQMISLERKRAERSRTPFLLMLLDPAQAPSAGNGGSAAHAIATVLSVATRETDVVGWYQQDVVVGAMFTELGLQEKSEILKSILTRVSTVLEERLTSEKFKQVEISFYWFPEQWKEASRRKSAAPVLYPDLAKRNQNRRFSVLAKRAMDIVCSLIALTLGIPIFACVALAVKSTSRGPVFFRQQRVGQFGVPFSLLKFRTMYENNNCAIHREYVKELIAGIAEKKPSNGNGRGVYKLTQDSRITPVGAFLRKISLDELPQFVNVLKGEMSLVGPRPPIQYEVEEYEPWHRRRVMEAKPGITGLWQVNGRNLIGFNEMVRLDLQYASSWSPWLDVKILFRTPKAVIAGAH
jgi:lipopolysaccharide/colanic/teichoic acid biosynthesis glycosyltransferase